MVNIAPATITPELDPMDWMITFWPSAFLILKTAESPTARMAMGMAASNTCPILRPEYAAAAEKMTAMRRPQMTDQGVTSGGVDLGSMTGRYSSPSWSSL
jgi:hypothetical protein